MSASVWRSTQLNRTGAVAMLLAAAALLAQALILMSAGDDLILSIARNAAMAERASGSNPALSALSESDIDERLAANRPLIVAEFKKSTSTMSYAKLIAGALLLVVALCIFADSRFIVRVIGIITGIFGTLGIILMIPRIGHNLSLIMNARLDFILLLDAATTILLPVSVVFVWIAVSGAGWTEIRSPAPPPPPPAPLPPRL